MSNMPELLSSKNKHNQDELLPVVVHRQVVIEASLRRIETALEPLKAQGGLPPEMEEAVVSRTASPDARNWSPYDQQAAISRGITAVNEALN